MCREDHDRTFRDLLDCFDCDCALGFKIGDDMRVVDNFVLYVDGFAVALERYLNYVYSLVERPEIPSNYIVPRLDHLLGIFCGSRSDCPDRC
jgi:hypothetical protein